jgi:hypothetical protein
MPNLTADEVVTQAYTRLGEFGGVYPSARGPMYRRIGYRQRHLFQLAAKVNSERYGACANADLTGGMADLNDIASPVATPARIDRVEVLDPGTSGYAAGDEITIVGVADAAAELAPRAYIRNGVVIGYGSDLDSVTSIRIFYPKLPDLFALTDSGKEIDLEAPWDTILELDLVCWLLEKATKVDVNVRAAALAGFTSEMNQLTKDFLRAAAEYGPVVSRFDLPRVVADLDDVDEQE